MALKDWKKKYTTPNWMGYIYYEKRDDMFWQGIYIMKITENTWSVEILDYSGKVVTAPVIVDKKEFSTKTKAINYAKKYMETH